MHVIVGAARAIGGRTESDREQGVKSSAASTALWDWLRPVLTVAACCRQAVVLKVGPRKLYSNHMMAPVRPAPGWLERASGKCADGTRNARLVLPVTTRLILDADAVEQGSTVQWSIWGIENVSVRVRGRTTSPLMLFLDHVRGHRR